MLMKRGPNSRPKIIRFIDKVMVGDGCWEWVGGSNGKGGYGRFNNGVRNVLAHRYAYEYFIGPVPEGRDLDHLCRNRMCVNPRHLEPVTRRENVVRGVSPNAINAAKTHCWRGHELTEENCYAYRWPNQRNCKQCARISMQEGRNRVRADATGTPCS